MPIGPWVAYARPLLSSEEIQQLRDELGPTLLVVLAHSWDEVERKSDMAACIDAVLSTVRAGGYASVIWLRHWKDPVLKGLPASWIVACNGHRSNPWFLDALRTLLELSDGMVSNAFGTHLGYGVSLGLRLHWLPVEAEQDLSILRSDKAEEEALEWEERQRLSGELGRCLCLPETESRAAVRALLDPYWGFDRIMDSPSLRRVLVGRSAGSES